MMRRYIWVTQILLRQWSWHPNVNFILQQVEKVKKKSESQSKYLSFYGSEIFGIDPDDDSGILEGNSVAYALNDRDEYSLPEEWIPIYDFDDGSMAYLDYSHLNKQKEPRVIMASYDGEEYEVVEILAEDFGDFVLQLVQEQTGE